MHFSVRLWKLFIFWFKKRNNNNIKNILITSQNLEKYYFSICFINPQIISLDWKFPIVIIPVSIVILLFYQRSLNDIHINILLTVSYPHLPQNTGTLLCCTARVLRMCGKRAPRSWQNTFALRWPRRVSPHLMLWTTMELQRSQRSTGWHFHVGATLFPQFLGRRCCYLKKGLRKNIISIFRKAINKKNKNI